MDQEILLLLKDLVKSLDSVAFSIDEKARPFWDTQWFAAMIGAVTALSFSFVKDVFSARIGHLEKFYNTLVENRTFVSPNSLWATARCTGYGCTIRSKYEKKEIPEKQISEKMVIELRKRCKYWTFPRCYLHWLFVRYEKSLWGIPDVKGEEIKKTDEYKKSINIYLKIIDLVEKKTGENEWTAR